MAVKVTVNYSPERSANPVTVSPDPVQLYTSQEPSKAEWAFESTAKGSKLKGIEFEESTPSGKALAHKRGPFSELADSDGKGALWKGACASDAEQGTYKYSVFIETAEGELIELDPQVVVDPDLGPG